MMVEPKRPLDPRLLAFARELRRQQTDAEAVMWSLLRDRRLAGCKFRRQYPLGPYVLDFYCQEARLAIELDGGAANEPGRAAIDELRTACMDEIAHNDWCCVVPSPPSRSSA